MRYNLLKYCYAYFRLAKLAAAGFDPLASLVQAKQEIANDNQALQKLDQIATLHGQIVNTVITDPKTNINQSISDLRNVQQNYNSLINKVSELDDTARENTGVGYFVENILNDANTVISQIQQTSMAMAGSLPSKLQQQFVDAILSASDTVISDDEVELYENSYGLVPEEYEEPQADIIQDFEEEKYDPFEEIEEQQEAQKETAYENRRQKVLEWKRKAWHKLFNKAIPQNQQLWKEVLSETERTFGEVSSDKAKSWAWHTYNRAGGGWNLYRDIHKQRQQKYREDIKKDPEKYTQYLERERQRNRNWRENLLEEKQKQRTQQKTKAKYKRRREKALEDRLKKLNQFIR